MGSIVKTIGKVIKKVGKALKKIAPILLVAAAAYVGYGYMTGFQQGGWPQITEWGKSLMGGVSQGQTLSQAANAAGAGTAMGSLDAQAVTSALPSGPATTSTAIEGGITDGMGLPDMGAATGVETGASTFGQGQTGLLNQIQDTTNTRFTSLMDQSLYPPLSNQVSSYLEAPAPTKQGGIGDFFLGTAQADPMQTGVPFSGMGAEPYRFDLPGHPGMVGATGYNPAIVAEGAAGANFFDGGNVAGGATFNAPTTTVAPTTTPSTVPYGGRNPYGWQSNQYGGMSGPHTEDPSAMAKIAGLGKKAWEVYKGMWKDNPWMAAWTTQKVIQTIMTLLDDTAEKESWRSRHVAGFEPGGWDDVRKRYGGRLPGTGSQKTGVWAGDAMRQSKIRTGPKISGGARTSAIDRKPQGLLGSQSPRALA